MTGRAPYRVEVTRAAERDLKSLPPEILPRIDAEILVLGEEPRPPGAKRLTDTEGLFRVRVGDYRILYEIDDDGHRVMIARVAHRRDAYR